MQLGKSLSSLIFETRRHWPSWASCNPLNILAFVIVIPKRLVAWIGKFDILKGHVLHWHIFGSQDYSWGSLWVVDCHISYHDVLVKRVRSITGRKRNSWPAERARMGRTKLSAIALLSWSDPNSILLWGIHHNILVSNIFDDTTIASEFHVYAFLSMMHVGISESDILHSAISDRAYS